MTVEEAGMLGAAATPVPMLRRNEIAVSVNPYR